MELVGKVQVVAGHSCRTPAFWESFSDSVPPGSPRNMLRLSADTCGYAEYGTVSKDPLHVSSAA